MSNPVKIGIFNNELEQRAKMMVNRIAEHLILKSIPLDGFMYKECDYKKGTSMPEIDDTFRVFGKDETC